MWEACVSFLFVLISISPSAGVCVLRPNASNNVCQVVCFHIAVPGPETFPQPANTTHTHTHDIRCLPLQPLMQELCSCGNSFMNFNGVTKIKNDSGTFFCSSSSSQTFLGIQAVRSLKTLDTQFTGISLF